ncbi:MAG: hypothetical protein RQ760_10575 [Sedimentisphaerales bacterium]|nr:hypothetical protein [Sedimentisphaerales bacterium]
MLLSSKPTIYFSEEAMNLDIWRIRKIAEAAQSLLPSVPGYHIFIKLDNHMGDRFMVTHGCTPNIPLDIWNAVLIDEGERSQIKWISVKK